MVTSSFVRLRIAPLQARQQPVWSFEGSRDPRHLHWSSIDDEGLTWTMKILFHAEDSPGLPPSIGMLRNDVARMAILEDLSECDRWGNVPKGLGDTNRPNPFLRRLGPVGPCSSEAAEDEEEEKEDDDDIEGSSSASTGQAALPQPSRKCATSPLASPNPAAGVQRRRPPAISGADE